MTTTKPADDTSDLRHDTASAIVLTPITSHVLLIHHRKSGLWLYPGGHVEPGEHTHDAALREVREETGIHATLALPALPAVTVHPAPYCVIEMDVSDRANGPHRHRDHVYLAVADRADTAAQLGEVSDARWVGVDEVGGLRVPRELPVLIRGAAQWLRILGAADPAP